MRPDEIILEKLAKASVLEGLDAASSALVFSVAFKASSEPFIWICRTNRDAEGLASYLKFFLDEADQDRILLLPGVETDPYSGLSPHPSITAKRAEALWKLSQGFDGIILTTPASILSRSLSPEAFAEKCIRLTIDGVANRDSLILQLRAMGYVREDPVSEAGEFSFRGGIVDVFSPAHDHPLRIEFFGDDIETIREFDPATQRSVQLLGECQIVPMREMIVTSEQITEWSERAPDYWNEVRFAQNLQEALQFTRNGELFNGFEYLMRLVVPTQSSLFDYLRGTQFTVIFQDGASLDEEMGHIWKRAREGYEDCSLDGTLALPPEELFFSSKWLADQVKSQRIFRVEDLSEERDEPIEFFDFRPERAYRSGFRELLSDLDKWLEDGEQVIFVMHSDGMAERLREILREYETYIPRAGSGFRAACEFPASITTGEISPGFYSTQLGLHVLSQEEVFGERKLRQTTTKARLPEAAGVFISDFRDLNPGDYVVHVEHGIGVFHGLKQIGVGNGDNEFVVIEYSQGSKLYVPVDRLDLIQKYSSAQGDRPSIDRLGGTSWAKTKARIRKSMRSLAEDLLKLYAQREMAQGHPYSPDDEMMREFEDSFEFDETPDQLTAIHAFKNDMESPKPMDRLICGDVGYGKTEVAMRAAFKAVNDGKQVAVLAPTTVLAFQHLNTFTERFKGFPVKVEMVSRFLSKADQKEAVERARLGMVDILIGTHRILSKDVAFQDLGLVIVDEEQRFGVAQKEKLKKLKAKVDFMTLSATPIPRTLNMSLVGIRDMSIIETPPKDRLAIQTVVMKYTRKTIRSAIDLELKRNGQVFFVHNSIETIFSIAQMIQETIPEARVCVAHGQMREELLEEVMLDFLNYRYDVLVSTTIIENGLDIPRANTIIINNADRFGLSQLYQLRGRVGRSNRRAYAYLLISADDVLSTDARRRLTAIREFSDLGSGFRLAAMDLEIRGAGNLLGGEQSGHISAVGFELYMKLLEQAVRELRGEEAVEEVPTTIDLRFDIQVPEHYVSDSNMRLWLYKRVSVSRDEASLDAFREEIIDRFGKYPRPVANLFEYARLRLRSQPLKIHAIELKSMRVALKFRHDTPVRPEDVIDMVSEDRDLSFSPDGSLVFDAKELTIPDIFKRLYSLMDRLSEGL